MCSWAVLRPRPLLCFGRLGFARPDTQDVGGWGGCATGEDELGNKVSPSGVPGAAPGRQGRRGIPGLRDVARAVPSEG